MSAERPARYESKPSKSITLEGLQYYETSSLIVPDFSALLICINSERECNLEWKDEYEEKWKLAGISEARTTSPFIIYPYAASPKLWLRFQNPDSYHSLKLFWYWRVLTLFDGLHCRGRRW